MHQDQVLFPCWISCGPCHWESSKFQLIKDKPELFDKLLVVNCSIICFVVYLGPAGAQGETMRSLNTGSGCMTQSYCQARVQVPNPLSQQAPNPDP